MKSKKVVYNRYSVDDLIVEKEHEDLIPKYLDVKDEKGNVLASLQIYFLEEEYEED